MCIYFFFVFSSPFVQLSAPSRFRDVRRRIIIANEYVLVSMYTLLAVRLLPELVSNKRNEF